MKEKVVCENLPQLADFVRLATPLARFGKVDRTATTPTDRLGMATAASGLEGHFHATALETEESIGATRPVSNACD
jgi:hypothetical protein